MRFVGLSLYLAIAIASAHAETVEVIEETSTPLKPIDAPPTTSSMGTTIISGEFSPVPPASDKSSPFDLKPHWKHGLELQTSDKQFRVHVGGRVQADAVTLDADKDFSQTLPGAGVQDAFHFRRARLRVDGTMFGFIDWATEYDFVNTVNDNAGLVGGLPNQPPSESNIIDVPHRPTSG